MNIYSSKKILHKHHIIPKHMGGTDDSSNLVELTVEEHAEAHRILFEQYGRWQDEIAWKGLAGIITKEEAVRIACGHSRGKKRPKEVTEKIVAKQKGQKRSDQTKQKMKEAWLHRSNKNIGKYVRTDEHRKKMSEVKKKKYEQIIDTHD